MIDDRFTVNFAFHRVLSLRENRANLLKFPLYEIRCVTMPDGNLESWASGPENVSCRVTIWDTYDISVEDGNEYILSIVIEVLKDVHGQDFNKVKFAENK